MTQQNENLKTEDGGSRPVDAVVRLPNHSYCDVCEMDNKRNALQVDGVKICAECANFLGNLNEVNRQVNYIKFYRSA